ncbi:MAG: transglycosylase SLT domain-containing protein, partial [Natronosporangium sp.]
VDPSPAPAPEPEPAPAPADEQPSDPVGPVPDSCGEYSGNRATGCALLLDAGHGLDQMSCLDNLWTKESGWNHRAQNPSSGAYGIPQALPGDKMAAYGDDWRTNPATQIRWGLSYIGDRYGSPCAAWRFSQANGWY